MSGKYGCFSADGKEFVIERPDTPRPWINYLYNRTGRYVSLLSANAGGYSFIDCPKDGRVTRWRYNSLPQDRPGRYLYLKDLSDNDYWTLSWQPTAKDIKHYRVRHGLGYTVFECDYRDVEAEATYFVPLDDTLELWNVRLKNKSQKTKVLEVYPFAEMCLGHALIDLINKPNDQHFNRSWFDTEHNALFSTKTYWVTGGSANVQENNAWDKVAFMASSLETEAYAGEREIFFGNYGDEAKPVGVIDGKLASCPVSSGNLVSCLKHTVTLEPGEELSFQVMLGAAEKKEAEPVNKGRDSFRFSNWEENAIELIKKYSTSEAVEKAFEDVKDYWRKYTDNVQVKTPSEVMNRYLNTWTQYQGKVTFVNSRNASYYHWGVTRGTGFRDSLQDIISVVITEPDLVRKQILKIGKYQREDGTCIHCFHPISGEGEFTGHKDDPLWLITAAWYYLAETGDFSLLDEPLPFHDGKDAVFMDHLLASVKFIEDNLGSNHIPTFGKGDWNDTLDFVGGFDGMGESIWAGMFYAYNLKLMIDIAKSARPDNQELAASLNQKLDSVSEALNTHAWDGDWYIRAVCSGGKLLGSNKCQNGKIYLNPQTWSVISGVASKERSAQVMEAVKKHLDTDFGPKLLAPAYHEIDDQIGLITRCVWGKKENAAIFNHTTTWCLMAECLLGHGDRAMALYEKIAPVSFDQERYQVEPYVYAQYTTSDEHETFGQGSHSWLTGTAAWMFRSVLDYILGVRPGLDGIKLVPCIASEWDGFSVRRKYRGTTYDIEVKNPQHVASGVKSISVDGEEIDPTGTLPVKESETLSVVVTMG
jgi:cellobiose phosphorylase